MKRSNREPLFHISQRGKIDFKKTLLIRALSIIAAFLVCALIIGIVYKCGPIAFLKSMFSGTFGTKRRIWQLFYYMAVLLGIAVALSPAFKMKFWNTGADGQVLVGGLACAACMFYMGANKASDTAIILVSLFASITAGMIWGIIPAVFKAFFKTNETLFTLMMNYIAIQLTSFFINTWDKSGHGMLNPMSQGNLPQIINQFFPTILVVIFITAIVTVYLKYSKHGFELSVVGESEPTAKYSGMNVKLIVIRTMALSGAICGLIGFLLVAGYNHTVATTTVDGRGFTAIIVAWLGKFNPLYMILTSFLVVFLQRGAGQLIIDLGIANSAFKDIIVGIFFFFIIGFEFFIRYKIMFIKREKNTPKDEKQEEVIEEKKDEEAKEVIEC